MAWHERGGPVTGKRRAARIRMEDRPWWPLGVSTVGTAYVLADAIKVVSSPTFLDGVVIGVSASMLVLMFKIAPRRDMYERHLSEAVCIHRRDEDPPGL